MELVRSGEHRRAEDPERHRDRGGEQVRGGARVSSARTKEWRAKRRRVRRRPPPPRARRCANETAKSSKAAAVVRWSGTPIERRCRSAATAISAPPPSGKVAPNRPSQGWIGA